MREMFTEYERVGRELLERQRLYVQVGIAVKYCRMGDTFREQSKNKRRYSEWSDLSGGTDYGSHFEVHHCGDGFGTDLR